MREKSADDENLSWTKSQIPLG